MVKVIAFDPSLRNWGAAIADVDNTEITILSTGVLKTKPVNIKRMSQNKKDLITAEELYTGLKKVLDPEAIYCVEVPHGSQSSRAMVSYGVCIALIALIRADNPKMVLVSANDVKAIVRRDKEHNPTKDDVINWVKANHPEAPLPTDKSVEHVCDAIVAIHAAMLKPEFKDYL